MPGKRDAQGAQADVPLESGRQPHSAQKITKLLSFTEFLDSQGPGRA